MVIFVCLHKFPLPHHFKSDLYKTHFNGCDYRTLLRISQVKCSLKFIWNLIKICHNIEHSSKFSDGYIQKAVSYHIKLSVLIFKFVIFNSNFRWVWMYEPIISFEINHICCWSKDKSFVLLTWWWRETKQISIIFC